MIDFIIPVAHAADAGAPGSAWLNFMLIGGFVLIFYFLIWRPQSKRNKDHRDLVASLAKGDEVVTNGGVVGKITHVDEQFMMVEVADNVQLKVQKGAVAAALPKGTLKSIGTGKSQDSKE